MEILNLFSPDQFKIFLLVLVRVSVVLFLFPIFGSSTIPSLVKAGLALIISMLIFPVVAIDVKLFPNNIVETGIMLFSEFMIGLTLGLTVRIFFGAIQLAGQIVGFQMGYSMINVVDPQTGANVSIMEQIGHWVVLLIFLALNGHHMLVTSLLESYQIVHVGFFELPENIITKFIELISQMFILGIKVAAPAMAALLFTSVAFGISGKFAPQMNIMMVAFPLKIAIGLVLFGMALQIIAVVTKQYLMQFKELLTTFLVWMGG